MQPALHGAGGPSVHAHAPRTRRPGRARVAWVMGLVVLLHLALLAALPQVLRPSDLWPLAHRQDGSSPVWVSGNVVLQPTVVPARPPAPADADTVAASLPTPAPVAARPTRGAPSASAGAPTGAGAADAGASTAASNGAGSVGPTFSAPAAASAENTAQGAINSIAEAATGDAAPAAAVAPLTAAGGASSADPTPAPSAQPATAALAATAAGQSAPAWWGAALAVPGSVRLRYAVTGQARGFGYEARSSVTWQHDGQRYEARMEVGALFLGNRVQTSVGMLGASGLEPVRFGDKARSEVAAHFEPSQQRVRFSANTPEAPWRPGSQDRLSVLFQLSALLAGDAGRWGATGQRLSFWTVGPRDAEHWNFVVQGWVPTQGSDGAASAVSDTQLLHLNRAPRREFDLTVDVWLAPSLGYLPARIRIAQGNGDWVDQRLVGVERP
jgi:hypothetical protein